MTTLAVNGLEIRRGQRPVLRAVDLRLGAGGMCAVLGPNGAGKSTLLRTLAGLLTPAAGRITLDGRALAQYSIAERARLIGYQAQNPALAWPLRVREVLALGRLPHVATLARLRAADHAAIALAARECGLDHLLERPADSLSGGERARMFMARLLAGQHRVLLADEPLADLDPRFQLEVLAAFKAHCALGGIALIVVHDLALARRHCGHALLLRDGEVHASGPSAEVMTADHIARVFELARDVAANVLGS